MTYQRTLKSSVELTGIGLHSGKPVRLVLRPARAGQGIVFYRSDIRDAMPVSGHFRNITNTQLATTISRGKVSVSTIEHLMAALQGAGVDNAVVEVDAPEIPIMDGSAHPFYEAIRSVGVVAQPVNKPMLVLRKKVEVRHADKWATAEPSSSLEIHATIDWNHPSIGPQEFHYVSGKTPFEQLSKARTFGFLRDVEALKRMGLARGGSLENAVVLDDSGILNPGGLRYPDEFVRHKVLDALGDFKLAGIEIQAYVRLHRAGHDLHGQLLSAIFRDPDNFEIIDASAEEKRPARITALATRLAATVS